VNSKNRVISFLILRTHLLSLQAFYSLERRGIFLKETPTRQRRTHPYTPPKRGLEEGSFLGAGGVAIQSLQIALSLMLLAMTFFVPPITKNPQNPKRILRIAP